MVMEGRSVDLTVILLIKFIRPDITPEHLPGRAIRQRCFEVRESAGKHRLSRPSGPL